ncbi:unnamed protein product [Adineta steineri]|uniref:Uncharacterized protein n=1 Tax=Adineta steineri TaxID=433720 RepID=A0A814KZ62_9BILA|nr:unnamed protein product [Adineta steineri]CAF1057672.1 unnamed protein product [Adineta steineri]
MEQPSITPSDFYFACRNNKLELVVQLLNDRPLEDIDRIEPNNSSALHAACYYKHADIIRLLLDRGFTRRVLNIHNELPIDEAGDEELRQLFHRSDLSNRFGGDISYEQEKLIWIVIDGTNQNLITKRMKDMYKGNRLEYGIFRGEEICQQLSNMPKCDVIRRYFRQAMEEKNSTRLIQAYTAETNFYNYVNNYLLTRDEQNLLSQFIQTIYFNEKLHKNYSFKGLCYRSIRVDFEHELSLYTKGSKISNQTFISATRERLLADEYVSRRCNQRQYTIMMIFKIRHDRTALDIENISEFPHEEEILIMFDSLFEVKDVIQKDKFYYEIKLYEVKSEYRR